ncbi:MAG TPA: SUMF1/EgtB/PvdO family nonheme iron enzyme, partial [Cyclobacteriaceae bacterium]|nr:SUMF1/EgtB/PvdO family nonheme iron enzyme [Cyclobacteriaceae bacterium]
MKTPINIIFFVTLSTVFQVSFSQSKNDSLPTPPNCVWLYGNLFIDKTEIANIHWLEYLYHLKNDSSESVYKMALPDTTVWLSFQDTLRFQHYLRYPGYRYFPVVGITHKQAVDYCKWRSQAVNMKRKAELKETKQVVFSFRLPSEKEWTFAAAG